MTRMKAAFLAFMAFTLAFNLSAQTEEHIQALVNGPAIAPEQTTAKLNKQPTPAFTLYLHASEDLVEKQWKQFVSTRYNCEFKKERKHYQALDLRMLDVADGTVSLYSVVRTDESGARLDVFVQSGTRFLESGQFAVECAKMENVLESFARLLYVEVYDQVLEDERKEHSKEIKDMEKLTKEGEKLDKETASSNDEVSKASEDITDNEQDIAALRLKIEELRLKIDAAEAELKRLEGEKAVNDKARKAQEALVQKRAARIEALKQRADAMRLR